MLIHRVGLWEIVIEQSLEQKLSQHESIWICPDSSFRLTVKKLSEFHDVKLTK